VEPDRRVDPAFVAADDEKLVCRARLDVFLPGVDRAGMPAVLGTIDDIGAGVTEVAGRPDNVLGRQRAVGRFNDESLIARFGNAVPPSAAAVIAAGESARGWIPVTATPVSTGSS